MMQRDPHHSSKKSFTLLDRARSLTDRLEPLTIEAEHIAATISLGVHGRQRKGPGDSFWQYRAYGFGDVTTRIDWRKSARTAQLFIRENEWEAANTLMIWVQNSADMEFHSHLSASSKRDYALLMALSLSALALRSNERVGILNSTQAAMHGRAALVRLAESLLNAPQGILPKTQSLRAGNSLVLFGDFYSDAEEISENISSLAGKGIRGHIVQIFDPAEEALPYKGHFVFQSPHDDLNFTAQKAETLRAAYRDKYQQHQKQLKMIANRLGWHFISHSTSAPTNTLLLSLYHLISKAKE